jgi:hypothetical protein
MDSKPIFKPNQRTVKLDPESLKILRVAIGSKGQPIPSPRGVETPSFNGVNIIDFLEDYYLKADLT